MSSQEHNVLEMADAFPLDLLQVWPALEFVKAAHDGRNRWDGTPEFYHLMSVASRCIKHGYTDTDTVIAALLHDVVEDTNVTLALVHDSFGYDVAEMVDALTQKRGESRDEYLARCLSTGDERVTAIKVADRCDNVWSLHTVPRVSAFAGHADQYFYELDTYFMGALVGVEPSLADELVLLVNRAKTYFSTGKLIEFPKAGVKFSRKK